MGAGRTQAWHIRAAVGLVAALVLVTAPAVRADDHESAPEPDTSPLVCDQYPGDPAPGTAAWQERDRNNIACATQRQQDILQNPAFFGKWAVENGNVAVENYPRIITELVTEPNRPRINPIWPNPSAKVGDPFRMPDEWADSGRGQMVRFRFVSSTGAHLVARLYAPIPDGPDERYPGIMFSPGLQSYNEVNSWFAQDLAEAGYVVLIIDPQGQGDSENCGHGADGSTGSCSGQDDIPSSINFLLSTPENPQPRSGEPNAEGTLLHNPFWELIDRETGVGIAGHSQGAIRITPVAQQDPRVAAVVSYDNLDGTLGNVQRTTPALYFYVDYAFPLTITPRNSPPNANQHMGIFNQLSSAGVDVMSITTRASTHYEWGYQPFPASFPASRYGERVSFHYTLAWFDRYLKGDPTAVDRLTAQHFDNSADRTSIGAGTFDPEAALADPTTPGAGNVPYAIAGKCAANLLSFYFHSAYHLEGGGLTSGDMRARGCDTADDPIATELTVTGDTAAPATERATLAARLVDDAGQPIRDAALRFDFQGEEHTATTGSQGDASVDVTVTGPAGPTPLTITFDGDDVRAASSSSTSFEVTHAPTTLTYSTERAPQGTSRVIAALGTATQSPEAVPGRVVTVHIDGDHVGEGTTDGTGTASIDVGRPRQNASVTVAFAGDDAYAAVTVTDQWRNSPGASGTAATAGGPAAGVEPIDGSTIAARFRPPAAGLAVVVLLGLVVMTSGLWARRRTITS